MPKKLIFMPRKKYHALAIKFPCLGKKITRVGNKITRVGNKIGKFTQVMPISCWLNEEKRRCVIMSKLQCCSSISDLVMYFSTLPSSSISAPCISLTLTQLKRVCRNLHFDTPSTLNLSLWVLKTSVVHRCRIGNMFIQ